MHGVRCGSWTSRRHPVRAEGVTGRVWTLEGGERQCHPLGQRYRRRICAGAAVDPSRVLHGGSVRSGRGLR